MARLATNITDEELAALAERLGIKGGIALGGNMAGLPGKTFSPIGATPEDEEQLLRKAQAMSPIGQGIQLPGPPRTKGVLPAPSPLMTGPEGKFGGFGRGGLAGLASAMLGQNELIGGFAPGGRRAAPGGPPVSGRMPGLPGLPPGGGPPYVSPGLLPDYGPEGGPGVPGPGGPEAPDVLGPGGGFGGGGGGPVTFGFERPGGRGGELDEGPVRTPSVMIAPGPGGAVLRGPTPPPYDLESGIGGVDTLGGGGPSLQEMLSRYREGRMGRG